MQARRHGFKRAIFWLFCVGALAACAHAAVSVATPTSMEQSRPVQPTSAAPPPEPAPQTAATPLPAAADEQRLYPEQLVYLGAFAFPPGDAWSYSSRALAYYPPGDPAGAGDGFPGSLFAAGHAWERLVGEISIPAPQIVRQFEALPQAAVLQPLADITGGWIDNCAYAPECEYREAAGMVYLPQVDKIAWNLRDWYNVAGSDQDSLGWSDPNLALAGETARGVWHVGPRGDPAFHNAKTSGYLLIAPEAFATQTLNGRALITGNHREAGAFGGSQGPTLFAVAPWMDGDPPQSGQELDAVALLYYPEVFACTENRFEACHFPGYRTADSWGGGAWAAAGGRTAVLIFGRKGLGDNCYGAPGEDCPASLCTDSKGWNADPYEPQILFYDPRELAEVAHGRRRPWEVTPYAVARPLAELFNPDCGRLDAVAYDAARQRLYVTEGSAGPWGATAVHVWQVQPD
jgi:hypothetical protein